MPRIPVTQLRLNTTVRKQLYLLREQTLSTTRTGSYILHVTLADRTGAIPGVLFDASPGQAEGLIVGRGVEVSGRVSEYKGHLQLTLERIVPAELTNLEEYLPVARRPLEDMEHELSELIDSVTDSHLARLLDVVFDERTLSLFCRAPAAKYNHHACVGGLLEHTLDVVRLALTACARYPELHRDLVVTAGILHDLGKIDAYDPVTFDLTEEGLLWSHLYRGASRVEQAVSSLPDFDPELRLRLVHAILAHHGHLEHGSPVLPMTPEAILIHGADKLDGDLRGALDHLGRAVDEAGAFTERSLMHETRLYRGMQEDGPIDQGTLW
ncbi:MAG: HD domain-containing protein [Chloroflexi bacterium]|nr:HD domain-containing protein [Chloroflexota bacterium]